MNKKASVKPHWLLFSHSLYGGPGTSMEWGLIGILSEQTAYNCLPVLRGSQNQCLGRVQARKTQKPCGLLGSADAAVVTAAPFLGSCYQLSEGKRHMQDTAISCELCACWEFKQGPLRLHPIWLTLRLDHTSSCDISGVSVHQRTLVLFCILTCNLMLRFCASSQDCLLSELYYKRCYLKEPGKCSPLYCHQQA